jgi:tetratricopeptide (TPR) repeat protein
MSRLTWFLGSKTEAEAYSIEAVEILEGVRSGPELAMAYSNRAQLHMLADQQQQAVLWGSRAIELAESLGATETLIHALNNVGTAELLVGNEHGRIKVEESLRLALANNLQEHAARAYTNLASSAVRERNYKLAMRYLHNGIAYTSEHDLDSWALYMTACRARAHLEQGDWESAADDAGLCWDITACQLSRGFRRLLCSATCESVAAILTPRGCWLRLATLRCRLESSNDSRQSPRRAQSLPGLKAT